MPLPPGCLLHSLILHTHVEGEYANGMRSQGKYVSGDGSIEYSGQWRDDLRHGTGTFYQRGLYRYTGLWKEDVRDGHGQCEYSDGSKYTGEWKNNLRHGKGELRHPNGDRFLGTFELGEMEGTGGAMYDNGDKYNGNWKEGKRHGAGRCVYAGGDLYEGEWRDDVREGKGQCKYKNGDRYQGMWKQNRRHGYGVCFFKDGTCFRGDWEDDCWVQSAADPSRTKVFGPGLLRAVAGVEASFGIQAYDEDGNKRLSGDDEFTVLVQHGDGSTTWGHVDDNGDGTYIASYTPTVAGAAELLVTLGADEPVSTSPFTLNIRAGVPSAKKLIMTGSGHRTAVRYGAATSTLVLHDAFGNRCPKSDASVTITAALTNQAGIDVPTILEDVGDGTYALSYTPQAIGFHRLNIYFNGVALVDCPFSVKVTAAPAIAGTNAHSKLEVLVNDEPVPDTITTWEKIAAEEFAADGDDDGWDSEPEEVETEEERYAREHPDVPIVENLEDLWKVGKVQKAMREANQRRKERELALITKRIAYSSSPSSPTSSGPTTAAATPVPAGGFD